MKQRKVGRKPLEHAKKTMKDLIDEKHELESTLSAVEKFILTLQNESSNL